MPLYSAIDPPDKKKLEQMKKKSERVILNRYMDSNIPYDNRRTIDVIRSAAKRSGVDPSFLAANALQEGMLTVFDKDYEGYTDVANDKYPVSGFTSYGLDTFGERVGDLKRAGYLPQDFDYNEINVRNERGQRYKSASFRNNEDALTAMGAMMRELRDKVSSYSAKKGLNLTPKMQDYLTMSAYNGGFGNAMQMVDEVAAGRYDQDKYISGGMTSRKGVHKNVAPRIEKQGWISEMYSANKPTVSKK